MYTQDDTIVAVSTPPGCGALGIVRLSGRASLSVAERVFHPSHIPSLSSAASHTAHVGQIIDGRDTLDETVATVFRAPHTATGEDVVEISAHGNPLIVTRIVELCCAQGARPAREGEFTFRAFMNGKIDLARAEAVSDLISARSTFAVKSAFRQLEGSLSRKVAEWKERLVRLSSCFEVALDYGEEDISFIKPEQARKEIGSLRADIAALKSTAAKGRYLRQGVHVSIIGKPNAGKSSLMNILLERERAIVTDVPGTTRDIIEETVEIGGYPFVLTDTAGLRRHTDDPVERIGLERSLDAMKNADIVLWLMDVSCPVSEEDRHIAGLLKTHDLTGKTLPVFNKCDLPQVLTVKDSASLLNLNTPPVFISALKATGVALLRQEPKAPFNPAPSRDECKRIPPPAREPGDFMSRGLSELEQALCARVATAQTDSTMYISTRHSDILSRADRSLVEADEAVARKDTEEIIAFHLRAALDTLNEITGENAAEDILKAIFSKFCVGK